jgi:hypothetical protein
MQGSDRLQQAQVFHGSVLAPYDGNRFLALYPITFPAALAKFPLDRDTMNQLLAALNDVLRPFQEKALRDALEHERREALRYAMALQGQLDDLPLDGFKLAG